MTTHLNSAKAMNAATIDRDETISFRALTPAQEPTLRPTLPEPEPAIENNGHLPVPQTPPKNRRLYILGGLGLLAAALATGFYYARFVAPYESTDDAFIETHVTPIAPQIAGQVARLLVSDNQEVKAGDVLVEIDPRDYQVKLDQALADLAADQSRFEQANAQFAVDQAKVAQQKANVVAVQAEAKRAAADLKRYQAVGNLGVSESQLDLADTQARSSTAGVDVARNKEFAAEAQMTLDKANIQTAAAEVQKGEAAVHQARIDLSYTRITAPAAGYVTHRTVEAGAYIQPGQSLLAIAPHEVWVVANFKETQLTYMRPGQPVEVRVDAYPQIKFQGRVDSIQAGAGARFSLLPPENASGNYVKVVQRVPVKIVLNTTTDSSYVLGAGMSVVPEVRVK